MKIPDSIRRGLGRRVRRVQMRVLRPWYARQLTRAGIVDIEYYQAQTGLKFRTARQVAKHYLASAALDDYSIHPLLEPNLLGGRRPRSAKDPAVRIATERIFSPHPLFDPVQARRALNLAPNTRVGQVWLKWVRSATEDTAVPVPPTEPPITWGQLRRLLIEGATQWREARGRWRTFGYPVQELPAGSVIPWSADRGTGPLVSVILATWNRAHLLREAIDSVLAQSYRNLELIVVDDGSSDDTAAIVAGVMSFDSRVRLISLPRSGVSAARNAGLEAALGEYVAFIDSDNTWNVDFLTDTVGTMTARKWKVAHAALQVSRRGKTNYRATDGDFHALLMGNFIDMNVLLAATETARAAVGFDVSMKRSVDYDYILRLAELETPHLVPTVAALYQEDQSDSIRISNVQAIGWASVAQSKHLVDWEVASQATRKAGALSVVLAVPKGLSDCIDSIRALDGADAELVCVAPLNRGHYNCLTALARCRDLKITQAANTGMSLVLNLGAIASSGERIIFVKDNASLTSSAALALAATLDDQSVAIAQPINESATMTVASAGAYFPPGDVVPSPLLAEHPTATAQRTAGAAVAGAYSAVIAMRAPDFIAIEGFDPLFHNTMFEVDLSLRAQERGLGQTVLVDAFAAVRTPMNRPAYPLDLPGSARLMKQRWATPPTGSAESLERAGFAATVHQATPLAGSTGPLAEVYVRTPELMPIPEPSSSPPCLRWAIDVAAPAGPKGAHWGDRHFANSLARSLRKLGQQVAVDHREARDRPSRKYDDVVLTLRGLDKVTPMPGPLNLLWVISHPDDVSPRELAAYDLAFAASIGWSAQKSQEWGLSIEPLLQCTDASLFSPTRATAAAASDVLFVGSTRGVSRPVVNYAVNAGADLAIFGRGWEKTAAADLVVAEQLPNSELGVRYASAAVVLNDHWADMLRNGFISNRLFDAAACGARVLSDRVAGADEVFSGLVQSFDTPADVTRLLSQPLDDNWPSQADRLAIAEQVRLEHSFDRRAEQLLDAALSSLEQRPADGLHRKATQPLTNW